MKEKTLLIDADGCCVLWDYFFDLYVIENGYNLRPDHTFKYKLSERYDGPEDHLQELMRQFNKSKIISSLPAFRDASQYLPRLKQKGFDIHVITSIGGNMESFHNRSDNLIRLFGRGTIQSLQCVPFHESKEIVLSRWKNSGHMWIEDLPKNAKLGLDLGLNSYLIEHDYNKGYFDNIPRVSNDTPWYDIFHILTDSTVFEKTG